MKQNWMKWMLWKHCYSINAVFWGYPQCNCSTYHKDSKHHELRYLNLYEPRYALHWLIMGLSEEYAFIFFRCWIMWLGLLDSVCMLLPFKAVGSEDVVLVKKKKKGERSALLASIDVGGLKWCIYWWMDLLHDGLVIVRLWSGLRVWLPRCIKN